LFGFVYYKTVATFPSAIFLVVIMLVVVSLLLLALVRPLSAGEDDAEDAKSHDETQVPEIQIFTREDTVVEIDDDDDEEPGRDAHTTRQD